MYPKSYTEFAEERDRISKKHEILLTNVSVDDEMTATIYGKGAFSFAEEGLKQFGAAIGVSGSYLIKCPPPLQADNIRFWLDESNPEGDKTIVLETKNNSIVGASTRSLDSVTPSSMVREIADTFGDDLEVTAFGEGKHYSLIDMKSSDLGQFRLAIPSSSTKEFYVAKLYEFEHDGKKYNAALTNEFSKVETARVNADGFLANVTFAVSSTMDNVFVDNADVDEDIDSYNVLSIVKALGEMFGLSNRLLGKVSGHTFGYIKGGNTWRELAEFIARSAHMYPGNEQVVERFAGYILQGNRPSLCASCNQVIPV